LISQVYSLLNWSGGILMEKEAIGGNVEFGFLCRTLG